MPGITNGSGEKATRPMLKDGIVRGKKMKNGGTEKCSTLTNTLKRFYVTTR